jgi:glutathione synthase/RimK-type ligase-like ATP-grasp enzyme
MSRARWQVVKHEPTGRSVEGGHRTLSVGEVPRPVIDTALKLAGLIGDGFYGVDLKENERGGVFAIEINGNPNLDAGIEDQVLGGWLYDAVMAEFVRRLEERPWSHAANKCLPVSFP